MAKRTVKKSSTESSVSIPTSRPEPMSMPGARPQVSAQPASSSREQQAMPQSAQASMRSAVDVSAVTHDMIAHRAYEIWRFEGGNDLTNWLRAERDLRTRNTQRGQRQ